MKIGKHEIEILVQGFPGKAQHHGGLGWSTVVMIRHGDRIALIDTGSFGMRALLVDRLAKLGVKPSDVTDILLTHAHHDHCVNWTLFRHARIVLGAQELDAALKDPWGETPTPELYVLKLKEWPSLFTVGNGEEVFPGITCYLTPGHTHGHLIFLLNAGEQDVIFSGDAAKNRAELISRRANMTLDAAVSSASIETIWKFWQRRPGTILVPGHDVPMILDNGECRYIGERQAGIVAWFGDNLRTTTTFRLTANSDRS